MDSRFFPEVLQVVPGDSYIVYAYFNDGTVRRYDASELVMGTGVFARLRDRQIFVNTDDRYEWLCGMGSRRKS